MRLNEPPAFSFTVQLCENGVVLCDYEISTDEMKRHIAMTRKEIRAWVMDWADTQADKIANYLETTGGMNGKT